MPEEIYTMGKKHQPKHERLTSRSAKKNTEKKFLIDSQENSSIDIDNNKSIYSSISKVARPKTPSAHKVLNNSTIEERKTINSEIKAKEF